MLEIEDIFIPGLRLINLKCFSDLRGVFVKIFNEDFFKSNNLSFDLKESYYSVSDKDVIRGMHFQIPPFAHTKLVYVNSGRILDVVLDIRSDSITYGKYFSVELTSDNPRLLFIPIGCAHGFLSKEPNSMVTYLQSTCYSPEHDAGIRYDSFGMKWELLNPVLSDRDNNFPDFNEFRTPF